MIRVTGICLGLQWFLFQTVSDEKLHPRIMMNTPEKIRWSAAKTLAALETGSESYKIIEDHNAYTFEIHILPQCIYASHRVRIGRVTCTIIVHDTAARIKKHFICSFRIRLESVTSHAFRVMQCLPIVAAGRSNQFSDRQKRGKPSNYRNGNEMAIFAKNHQILSGIKV
jgi:hypothetical protein